MNHPGLVVPRSAASMSQQTEIRRGGQPVQARRLRRNFAQSRIVILAAAAEAEQPSPFAAM
jgi:hypothetical protein